MKTRSADFDVAWGRKRTRKGVYKITYQRNYWNGSAYVLESTERTISRREIHRVTGLNWKFDVPQKSKIESSNVTLQLKDNTYKWLPSNTASGIWRPDATAAAGYEPQFSRFTLHYGYRLDDETDEYLAIFTGLLIDDPKFDSESGTVTLLIMGEGEARLEAADAQNVCTTLTDQTTNPAAGDGSVTVFDSQAMSLWQITNVRKAAVMQSQGSDFTLNDLNDAEVDSSIEFSSPPVAAATILYDAKQWYRDKSFSFLIGALCDEAGIISARRYIEEPIFDGVDSSWTQDSQSDFNAGTLSSVDATYKPGKIGGPWITIDRFDDNKISSRTEPGAQDWTNVASSGNASVQAANYSISFVAGQIGSAYSHNRISFAVNTGTFRTKVLVEEVTAPGATAGTGPYWLPFGNDSNSSNVLTGYGLRWNAANGNVEFVFWNAEDSMAGTVLATVATSHDIGTQVKWAIVRAAGGNWTVYKDGVSVGTAVENTVTTNNYLIVGGRIFGTPNNEIVIYFDDFDYSTQTSGWTGTWTSAERNLSAAPTSWLPITYTQGIGDVGDATLVLKTNVASASGGPYDGAVAVDAGNTPQSALKQYAKMIIEFTSTITGEPTYVDLIRLNWRSANLFIKSADFTGLTCLQAVAELAKAAGNVEFGTRGDGVFFFRNKSSSRTPHLVLSHHNALSKIQDLTPGYRNVRNVGQVYYGQSGANGYYYAEYGATEAGEASPTTAERFGQKPLRVDLTRFIFSNNANVANAFARAIYSDGYRPKRTAKILSRIIPQLDLSDVLQVSFHDSPLIEKNVFGDQFQKGFPTMGANSKTLLRDAIFKVVGLSPDINKGTETIDVEEILA